jgi:hypothetical protein
MRWPVSRGGFAAILGCIALLGCEQPTQTIVETQAASSPEQPPEEPTAPAWEPEALHVYTFPAEIDAFSEAAIVDEWEFSEADYADMLDRVEAMVEIHNRDNPGDQLQAIGGGL